MLALKNMSGIVMVMGIWNGLQYSSFRECIISTSNINTEAFIDKLLGLILSCNQNDFALSTVRRRYLARQTWS